MKKKILTILLTLLSGTGMLFASNGIGLFSVSATQQVTFSPGNLQYQASTNTWRFAPNQWDYVGSANKNISSSYNGWIDLFCWGTSGWNSGANAYQPYSTSTSYSDYYPGGSSSNNLTGNYANADWGVYNQIGDDAPGSWRTLTKDEWVYLFHGRTNYANLFGLGTVNGVQGTIILPDSWVTPVGLTFTPSTGKGLSWLGSYYYNKDGTHYSDNTYTSSQWELMESAGAVFLPAAGGRDGSSVNDVGNYGDYWSSTQHGTGYACSLYFGSYGLYPQGISSRYYGHSVRLVRAGQGEQEPVYSLKVSVEGEGTVTGVGEYKSGTTATLTATPASGYTFTQWSDGNTDNPRTITMTQNLTLTAVFTAVGGGSTGGIGQFSVSVTQQVTFSPGNLQYQASTNTWRFAEHQWDIVGMGYGQTNTDNWCDIGGTVANSDNRQIGSTYSGWIDLFGWGTGNAPTKSSEDYNDYSTFVDWGTNAISNGGNQANMWRTLTNDEWVYLFNTRANASSKYGAAKVNGVTGVVVLPDNWTWPVGCGFTAGMTIASNDYDWSYVATTNIYTSAQWQLMESAGAVFLPAAGDRSGSSVGHSGSFGLYWSSTQDGSSGAYILGFFTSYLSPQGSSNRGSGKSVRLVQAAQGEQEPVYTLTISIEGEGTVTGAGEYKNGEIATLTATAASGYTFTQWSDDKTDNPRTITMTQNLTLTAVFVKNTFLVSFLNYDGTELQSSEVEAGTMPQYNGTEPTKPADAQYTYTFAGWDKEIAAVTANATYTATYTRTVNQYTVIFKNEDGSILDSRLWNYGATPTCTEPTKPADAQYTYTFAGWDKEIAAVTANATYTATYSRTVNQYTVTFKNEDGTVLDSRLWNYGATPTCSEPTKPADAQYTYTFAGWDKEIAAVTANATYTAIYTRTVNQYTVTFKNEDGSILDSRLWNYGATPTCTEPTKPADAQYTYTFAGWDKEIAAVTADATYTATYSRTINQYTVTFMDGNTVLGEPQTVEYGQSATAPEVEIPQCRSLSWDKDFSNITCDLTVIAVWTETLLASGTCGKDGKNLTWELTCDGTLSINGIGDMDSYYWFMEWSFAPWEKYADQILYVNIGSEVTSIGSVAFYNCSKIQSIVIPKSVTSIGSQAFSYCKDLASIVVEEGNTIYDSRDNCNAVIKTSSNQLIAGCKNTFIPNTVVGIAENAFEGSGLTTIMIPNSVKQIGMEAFSSCESLVSVNIPESVTSIPNGTFQGCSSLESVFIPSNVRTLGGNAFNYCKNLSAVTFESDVPPAMITGNLYGHFMGCTCTFYVPCGSKNAYITALGTTAERVVETGMPDFSYSITSSDTKQGTVIITKEPASCEDMVLSFRADAVDDYRFVKWSDGNTDNPRSLTLTGDIALTALFEPIVVPCSTVVVTDGATIFADQLPYTWEDVTFKSAGTEIKMLKTVNGCDSVVVFTLRVLSKEIVLHENESADYYTQFAQDYNGRTVNTATLNRQFTQGRWATLCLPFNVNKAMMMSLGLYNRVFAFRYAQQLDDETIQVFFTPAQSIEAGKGYIVNPNAKLAAKTSFVFPNVTINTDSDNGDITTLTGYNDGTGRGNLFLVGTLRTGMLQGATTGNTYLGLKDNQLYYPNSTSGTLMRAYRAVFRSDIPVNASRVRIIAEGEPVSELQVVGTAPSDGSDKSDPSYTPARKYIEKGILYIERNGITYTAQGHRLY